MKYYSTKNKNNYYTLQEAVLKGLPDDNGLFMPQYIPKLSNDFWSTLNQRSFQEICFEMANAFLQYDVPNDIIRNIVNTSINFEAPLVRLDEKNYILELFHGPTLAFKDFGARFMANLMQYFVKYSDKKLTILVATSGDTGSAVANGFYEVDGIDVVILYPKGKVSLLQEKQLTTLGKNITALEIEGTFDDCQALVKQAFLDKELTTVLQLSSANSINIARLIPQSFYYANAVKQIDNADAEIVFSVPSGNFGNLTAGLIAKQMGLPVKHFVAATNLNRIIPKYLQTGVYQPKPSLQTISNAMDVGNPSNYQRMIDLYEGDIRKLRNDVLGFSFDDAATKNAILEVMEKYKYIIDPHGAVAYLGAMEYQKLNKNVTNIILETAHPAKFSDVIEDTLNIKIALPIQLKEIVDKQKKSINMSSDFEKFKAYLLSR